MSAQTSAMSDPATSPSKPTLKALRPGWITIAAKEFADHLLSARLYVLLVVLGIAALIPLYFAAERIRSVAASASTTPAVFLFLFQLSPEGIPILRVDLWIEGSCTRCGAQISRPPSLPHGSQAGEGPPAVPA